MNKRYFLTFNSVAEQVLLHCWVESQRSEASRRAELVFRDMKQRFEKGNKDLRPDCISYSIVMNTFAQETKYKEAEDLLWEMTDDFLSGNASAKPRTRNFNTIVAMYANNADAPERAEAVVHRFRELASTGALSGAQPDEYTYSLLLKSWVSSSRPDGVYNASACLSWMRSLFNMGDNAACPDVIKVSIRWMSGDSFQKTKTHSAHYPYSILVHNHYHCICSQGQLYHGCESTQRHD
jgi:hypothetical protein